MPEIDARAASYAGPEGYGSTLGGWQRWGAGCGKSGRLLDPGRMRWPSDLKTPCPRFGRMDALSKAAVVATELLRDCFSGASPSQRAVIGVGIETYAGSLGSNVSFVRTGSPSVFVYTLPSSAIGEICIRHGFMGPVVCFCAGTGGRLALRECLRWVGAGEARAAVCLACEAVDRASARLAGYRPRGANDAPWEVGALYVEARPEERRGRSAIDLENADSSLLNMCRRLPRADGMPNLRDGSCA